MAIQAFNTEKRHLERWFYIYKYDLVIQNTYKIQILDLLLCPFEVQK